MKLRILFFLLFLLNCPLLKAQDITVAFFTSEERLNNDYERAVHDTLVKALTTNKKINFLNYSWNEKTGAINYDPKLNVGKIEQPAKYLIFLNNNVIYSNEPEVQFRTDTSKNIIEAWIPLNYKSIIDYKVVDFKSSEILHFKTSESTSFGTGMNAGTIRIKDFSKYFGKNLKKLSDKEMKAAQAKVRKAYRPQIIKKYNNANQIATQYTYSVPGSILGLMDNKVYQINKSKMEDVGKRLKEFSIKGGKKDKFPRYAHFSVYQINQIGEYRFSSFVASAFAKEIGETETTMKTFPFARKRMAEAFKSENELLVVRNKYAIKDKNTVDKVDYRISLDKTCILCDSKLEVNLSKINNITLIERSHTPVLDFLNEHYKSEKFLDFEMSDYQSQQEGVAILLKRNTKGITITDVKTGKIIDTSKKIYGDEVASALLQFSGEEIKFLQVAKKKKNKITDVTIYHPFGLFLGSYFEVKKIVEEKVRGEVIQRNEKIADGYIRKELGFNIGNLKISKGKKDLFQAIEEGAKIVIVPKGK